MNKPISKDLHGLIDYSYALLVPALPKLVGFKQPAAVKLCQTLGAGALAYSLLTKARWGLFKVLPFKAHLGIDAAVSCLALAAPVALGFAHHTRARNTLLAVAVAGLTASLLTDPKESSGNAVH